MNQSVRLQLSVMMFLEFFIWGGWFVTMSTYLSKSLAANDVQIGLAYQTQSIGAIVAPFIIGLIADRFFAAQKILGILHIAGAILLWMAGTQADFGGFYPMVLIYMILFMPTLALVNSISFRQMQDPAKDFPSIRVLGTIGWIVAGLTIGWLAWESQNTLANTFRMAAVASGLLGIFSFMLPNTPPPNANASAVKIGDLLGFEALRLLKDRSFLVFFLGSVLLCVPLAFYYNFTNLFLNELGVSGAAGKMSMGQMSEVAFMLAMPWFFKRLGVKKMLLLGMGAWMVRYLLFAFGNAGDLIWLLLLGIILHGICYDFFFVTGQIYTDRQAGEKVKSAAQGLITLATYGVGMLIGSYISGFIVGMYKTEAGHAWQQVWLVPAAISAVVLLGFALLFRDRQKVAV
ncbi:MAG: nucleoside permease [Saprospiraceae bacterium]